MKTEGAEELWRSNEWLAWELRVSMTSDDPWIVVMTMIVIMIIHDSDSGYDWFVPKLTIVGSPIFLHKSLYGHNNLSSYARL